MKHTKLVIVTAITFIAISTKAQWNWTSNPPHMYNTNSGNVGINNTNPTQKLSVRGNNSATTNIAGFLAANRTQGIGIGYNAIRAIGLNVDVDLNLMAKGPAGHMRFYQNGLERMNINEAGDLFIDWGGINNGASTGGALRFGTESGEAIASKRSANGNQYGLDFYTNSTNRMSIANDGNVGINLTPLSTGFNAAILQLKSDGDDNLRLIANDNANDWSIFSNDGTGGDLDLYKNGDFRGSFNATSGVYAPSDKRLKKDVVKMQTVLNDVMRLQPKKYHFNESASSQKLSYGFIAQEVNEIFPEFVGSHKDRKTGVEILTLNYASFAVIAIKAIQEQQQQIERQQSQIEKLEQLVSRLSQSLPATAVNENASTKTAVSLTDSKLGQNVPNPLTKTSSISYSVPQNVKNVQLIITSNTGKSIKQIKLTPGNGVATIDASSLSSGTYNYSLLVDGKIIESKKMTVVR